MSMMEAMNCNACGAPLRVPSNTAYIKCNHCQTQLAVHRGSDVSFTESIDQLNQTTQSLREQVDRLATQQEIADLDRSWEVQQKDFMVSGKDGRQHLPTESTAMIGVVVAIVFGVFWTIFAFAITANSPFGAAKAFPIFGILFIAFGIFAAIKNANKATEYTRAQSRYRRKRAALKRIKKR